MQRRVERILLPPSHSLHRRGEVSSVAISENRSSNLLLHSSRQAPPFRRTSAISALPKTRPKIFSQQSAPRNSPFPNFLRHKQLQPQNHPGGGLFFLLEIARNACLYLRSVTAFSGYREPSDTRKRPQHQLPREVPHGRKTKQKNQHRHKLAER
jgi:hypothetical protein